MTSKCIVIKPRISSDAQVQNYRTKKEKENENENENAKKHTGDSISKPPEPKLIRFSLITYRCAGDMNDWIKEKFSDNALVNFHVIERNKAAEYVKYLAELFNQDYYDLYYIMIPSGPETMEDDVIDLLEFDKNFTCIDKYQIQISRDNNSNTIFRHAYAISNEDYVIQGERIQFFKAWKSRLEHDISRKNFTYTFLVSRDQYRLAYDLSIKLDYIMYLPLYETTTE